MEDVPLTLSELGDQAARARRLAWLIPSDPMGRRLAEIAKELEAEINTRHLSEGSS
jgi:hypothetical protein